MIDIQEQEHCPTLEEMSAYVRNPVFDEFCSEISGKYHIKEKMEFSKCSWEMGWNIKFRKSGKSLCTIYPRENYFTVLVVVGKKEKDPVEMFLPEGSPAMREIYHQTREGNGQKWLMIDLEDCDNLYEDVIRLIDIRKESR